MQARTTTLFATGGRKPCTWLCLLKLPTPWCISLKPVRQCPIPVLTFEATLVLYRTTSRLMLLFVLNSRCCMVELAIRLLERTTGCRRRKISPRMNPTRLPSGSPNRWKTVGITPELSILRLRNA